jgi:hypothetical protein
MFLTKALPALARRPQGAAAALPQPEAAGRPPSPALVPRWAALRLPQGLLLASALLLGGAPLPAAAQTTPPTFLVSGVITALGPSPVLGGLGTVTIGTSSSGSFTFLVTAQTVIMRNGLPAKYGSLRLGDFCKAAVTWNGTVWVATQISDSSNVAAARAAMTRSLMLRNRRQ